MASPILRLFVLLLLAAASPDGDRTLITKKGEVLRGKVTPAGDTVVVETLSGSRSIPAAEVGCVFDDPHEIVVLAEERTQEAKKIYAEVERLPPTDGGRNRKILAAVEIAQGVATLYNLVEPHCRGDDKAVIARNLQVVLQFVRLCRGLATSEMAGGMEAEGVKPIALLEVHFSFKAPEPPDRPWVLKENLGPGLGAFERDLANPDQAKRLDAVAHLSHPPDVLHLATLLKLLESEREPEILRVLADGLAWQEPSTVLKSLGWAKREPDPLKRSIAFSIARAAGDRVAFDFLFDWFVEAPPAKHEDRAAFGSVFHRHHAWSVERLRELLFKQRNAKLQVEIVRQMGAVGDKACAPFLVKAMSAFPRDSVVSLLKIGKPAVPAIIEGTRSDQPETRRLSLGLLRKLTGVTTNTQLYENWWTANKKQVIEDEKSWWEEQAKQGYTVAPAFFAPYDQPLEAIVN